MLCCTYPIPRVDRTKVRRLDHQVRGGVRSIRVAHDSSSASRVHLGVLGSVQVVDEDVAGHLRVLGVVLQHGGHGVVVVRLLAVVVVARLPPAAGAAAAVVPVGVEPEVIAVGEVEVADVVDLMQWH